MLRYTYSFYLEKTKGMTLLTSGFSVRNTCKYIYICTSGLPTLRRTRAPTPSSCSTDNTAFWTVLDFIMDTGRVPIQQKWFVGNKNGLRRWQLCLVARQLVVVLQAPSMADKVRVTTCELYRCRILKR